MAILTIVLRVVVGLFIVASAVHAGYAHRSPWIIPLLAVVFAIMYIAGKPVVFRTLRGPGIFLATLAAIPVQFVVVGVLYLFGFGLGSLVADHGGVQPFTRADLNFAGWVLALGGFGGALATFLEMRSGMIDPESDPEAFVRQLIGDLDGEEEEVGADERRDPSRSAGSQDDT